MMRQSINLMVIFGLLLALACAGTKIDGKLITPQNLNDIAGIEWHLKQMTKNNEIITLVKDSRTTFVCDENGNVSGQATINRYSGNLKFQDDGEIIWTKAFIMTRMAGPPQLMGQEADFTQVLMQTSRMILNDSKLVLKSTNGSTVLEFHSANK